MVYLCGPKEEKLENHWFKLEDFIFGWNAFWCSYLILSKLAIYILMHAGFRWYYIHFLSFLWVCGWEGDQLGVSHQTTVQERPAEVSKYPPSWQNDQLKAIFSDQGFMDALYSSAIKNITMLENHTLYNITDLMLVFWWGNHLIPW